MSTASKGKGGFHYLVSGPARACVIARHPVWPFAGPDVIAGYPLWPFAGPVLFVPTAAGRHAGFVVSPVADAAGAATHAPAAAEWDLAAAVARPSVTENTLNQIRNQAVTVKMRFSYK